MIPTPIHKVLSTFQKHGVRALLMGGQACVLYGAAQFSKDADFLLFADEENFERLHYREHGQEPTPERIRFWLGQSRTPETTLLLVQRFPDEARELIADRPFLEAALAGDLARVRDGLNEEELRDRQRDREYWAPLKAEMETFRRAERSRE